jgi:peptide/nickel transport system ATP-binding protein
MYAGRIVEEAPSALLFAGPAHPYTRGLLGALPPLEGERRPLASIPGGVPDPLAMPPGCAFAPRCPLHTAACDAGAPADRAVAAGHRAACIAAEARHGAMVPA